MDGWAEHVPGVTVWTLALLLVLFLAIPVGALIVRAVAAEEGWDSRTYDILRQSLGLSLAMTALSMVLVIVSGTSLPCLLARRRFQGAAAVEALVHLPMVLPPAVAGILRCLWPSVARAWSDSGLREAASRSDSPLLPWSWPKSSSRRRST
jgi:ABC-type sulfate transport system permease component